MSKKQKRQVSNAPRKVIREAPAQPIASPAPQPARSRFSETVKFDPDYTPVIHDLKRIGVLAGSFIAFLVVLSFVLPYILK